MVSRTTIAALGAAIIAHEAAGSHMVDLSSNELAAAGDSVRLRARAGPFIALLRNSELAGKDGVWGV